MEKQHKNAHQIRKKESENQWHLMSAENWTFGMVE